MYGDEDDEEMRKGLGGAEILSTRKNKQIMNKMY